MPKHITRDLVLFVFVVAIAVAANRAEEHEGLETNTVAGIQSGGRGPASVGGVASSKAYVLNAEAGRYIRHTEKLSGPVSVEIKMDNAKPSQAGDIMVMRGVISASDNLDRVDFQWAVPDGVEVIMGEITGTITDLKSGEDREVTLTVKANSVDNQQIHIMVKGDSPAMHFAQSAQYNTVNQEALEAANKAQQKMLDDSAPEESNLKIYH